MPGTTAETKQQVDDSIASLDLESLRRLAVSPGGFRTRLLRIKAWHTLLGLDKTAASSLPASPLLLPSSLPSANKCGCLLHHSDREIAHQVDVDTARSFIQFTGSIVTEKKAVHLSSAFTPPSSTSTVSLPRTLAVVARKEAMVKHRAAIKDIILRVLSRFSNLNYYQGYHDIASVIYSLYNSRTKTFKILSRVTTLHLLDFMEPGMATSTTYTYLIHLLLERSDPDLYSALKPCGDVKLVGKPTGGTAVVGMYALSWIITAFSHDLDRIDAALRVMDGLVSYGACFLVYIAAAFLRLGRQEIIGKFGARKRPTPNSSTNDMTASFGFDDDDDVMPMLHAYLSSGVVNSKMVDLALVDAGQMLDRMPISELIALHTRARSGTLKPSLHDACGTRFDIQVRSRTGVGQSRSTQCIGNVFCDSCTLDAFRIRCERLDALSRKQEKQLKWSRWLRKHHPLIVAVSVVVVAAVAVGVGYSLLRSGEPISSTPRAEL
ncbi:hypothetical protein BSLG_000569 [Batrachochytrium salamandrivorans]|nr:hypothetical protein BSLG_000569 [Batrachochytrium salamandrivorans]